MLDSFKIGREQKTVYRLAAIHDDQSSIDLFRRRNAKLAKLSIIKEILSRLNAPFTVDEFIDETFRPTHDGVTPFPVTRFSDGTFGVYYSAIEELTCKREVEFHLNNQISENRSRRVIGKRYYYLIKCKFLGTAANLLGQERNYQALVSLSDSGYAFCQKLGLEARKKNIDGFLTRSARNIPGTCVPVFARDALSESNVESRHELTITKNSVKIHFKSSDG